MASTTTTSSTVPKGAESPPPTASPIPKVLAFDVFGTVVDWHGSIAREAERIVPGLDGDAFALAWREGYRPAMARTMASGQFRVLDELHLEILRDIAPRFGLALTPEQEDELNKAWHRLDPWPDSAAALARLKTKFIITPLSNGGIGLLTHMAKRGGLPWDVVLCAEVFQAYKPAHRVYQGVGRVLGVPIAEVMMVATHHDDLDAAQDAGLQTAYIARPLEFGAKHTELKDSERKERHPLHFDSIHGLADHFGC
ncbi:(S)-2-haloacid dehalogenase [Vanrija pseudolonga]|uniref:(S)-2-haloacid dehalogenase n=1 Tax=Vanrija pseudolonga TaxID=143232 RepID=A0AAF0YDV0_9TREE|nr:(S)-2-haloacid dehalogenase [Vanrija pseudolonga]